MPCKKSLDVIVHATPQAVFNFLCAQGTILNDYVVKYADRQKLTVFLKGKINWLSWGEDITIETRSEADTVTRVTIISKPAVPTTLIDWGRNQENVNKIAQFLYSVFPFPVAPAHQQLSANN